MKIRRRKFLQFAVAIVAVHAFSQVATAQPYRTHRITNRSGICRGGATDTTARILAQRMTPLLGAQVIIENVTGANGSIAVGRVVRAAADGYTLSYGDLSTYVANQVTYPVAYDLRTDLQPIALAAFLPALVVTRGGMPGGNLKELTDWLLTTGTGGVGGSEHLAGLLFQQITQTRFQFIPSAAVRRPFKTCRARST
jgi:tripartite-type tricarboxylate transporter receptor subunit TctC